MQPLNSIQSASSHLFLGRVVFKCPMIFILLFEACKFVKVNMYPERLFFKKTCPCF